MEVSCLDKMNYRIKTGCSLLLNSCSGNENIVFTRTRRQLHPQVIFYFNFVKDIKYMLIKNFCEN